MKTKIHAKMLRCKGIMKSIIFGKIFSATSINTLVVEFIQIILYLSFLFVYFCVNSSATAESSEDGWLKFFCLSELGIEC